MVPSLPFVLINVKTDLPEIGHENITGELIKKKMWETISVRGCKQNKEYFKCKTRAFNSLFPKARHLRYMDAHTQKYVLGRSYWLLP